MVAITGTFFPYLVHYTQNIPLVDIGRISRSRAMVRVMQLELQISKEMAIMDGRFKYVGEVVRRNKTFKGGVSSAT